MREIWEMDVYRLAERLSDEETKAWLRKAIRRHVIASKGRIDEYKALVDELGPKLNGFIRATGRPAA